MLPCPNRLQSLARRTWSCCTTGKGRLLKQKLRVSLLYCRARTGLGTCLLFPDFWQRHAQSRRLARQREFVLVVPSCELNVVQGSAIYFSSRRMSQHARTGEGLKLKPYSRSASACVPGNSNKLKRCRTNGGCNP